MFILPKKLTKQLATEIQPFFKAYYEDIIPHDTEMWNELNEIIVLNEIIATCENEWFVNTEDRNEDIDRAPETSQLEKMIINFLKNKRYGVKMMNFNVLLDTVTLSQYRASLCYSKGKVPSIKFWQVVEEHIAKLEEGMTLLKDKYPYGLTVKVPLARGRVRTSRYTVDLLEYALLHYPWLVDGSKAPTGSKVTRHRK
tara:strand:- start:15682 stop:16275 length:594 start_codon:yes stop_codon:yes gene_type:complete